MYGLFSLPFLFIDILPKKGYFCCVFDRHGRVGECLAFLYQCQIIWRPKKKKKDFLPKGFVESLELLAGQLMISLRHELVEDHFLVWVFRLYVIDDSQRTNREFLLHSVVGQLCA